MKLEIERKYLVKYLPEEVSLSDNYEITSGYTSKETSSRVNYCKSPTRETGFVTFKGKGDLSRNEYEYNIPANEAFQMVEDKSICPFVIKKTRYNFLYKNKLWEIDKYHSIYLNGKNLIVAEVELENENDSFDVPDFIEKEITGFKGISNHSLAVNGITDKLESLLK